MVSVAAVERAVTALDGYADRYLICLTLGQQFYSDLAVASDGKCLPFGGTLCAPHLPVMKVHHRLDNTAG